MKREHGHRFAAGAALATVLLLGIGLAGATNAERPVARRALDRSECGPTGCPARPAHPWQHTAGFALAVAAAIWAAPRRKTSGSLPGAPPVGNPSVGNPAGPEAPGAGRASAAPPDADR